MAPTQDVPAVSKPVGADGLFIGSDLPGHEHYSGNWDDIVESGKKDPEADKLLASWRSKKKDAAATAYLQEKWPDFYGAADQAPGYISDTAYMCQYLYDGYGMGGIDKDISDYESGMEGPTLSLMSFYCDSTLEEYLTEQGKTSVWKLKGMQAPDHKL